jgi:hypothetical protein
MGRNASWGAWFSRHDESTEFVVLHQQVATPAGGRGSPDSSSGLVVIGCLASSQRQLGGVVLQPPGGAGPPPRAIDPSQRQLGGVVLQTSVGRRAPSRPRSESQRQLGGVVLQTRGRGGLRSRGFQVATPAGGRGSPDARRWSRSRSRRVVATPPRWLSSRDVGLSTSRSYFQWYSCGISTLSHFGSSGTMWPGSVMARIHDEKSGGVTSPTLLRCTSARIMPCAR